jgi:hypothetical protein
MPNARGVKVPFRENAFRSSEIPEHVTIWFFENIESCKCLSGNYVVAIHELPLQYMISTSLLEFFKKTKLLSEH